MLGLPGGPQEGSLSGDSSILTFAAGPQKGSNTEAKIERFGLPNPSYTHFGSPFVRNRCPKSCIEKRLQHLGSIISRPCPIISRPCAHRTARVTEMTSKMPPGTPKVHQKRPQKKYSAGRHGGKANKIEKMQAFPPARWDVLGS